MYVEVICRFDGDIFFFMQKTAYEMRISDWSSDVCSSDLRIAVADQRPRAAAAGQDVDLFGPKVDEQAAILEHVDADQPRRADMPPGKGGRVEGRQAEVGHVQRGDPEARRDRGADADRREPQFFAPPEPEALGQFARDDGPPGAGVDEDGKGRPEE